MIVFGLQLAMLASALGGGGRSRPDTLPADSVIARYVGAVGGMAAIRGDTTLRMSGRYVEGDFAAVTTILWRRPNLRRVSVITPDHFAYVELYDGTDEWEFSESFAAPIRHDSGAALRAGQRGAEFDESVVDYRAKGHRVSSCPRANVGGKSTDCVEVILSDGWAKQYYFDPATGLIVALRKAMPLHAKGPDLESLSYYSDWRRVGSVLRPFRTEEREARSGRLMNTLQWEKIESNVPIRAEAFVRPGSATPSQPSG